VAVDRGGGLKADAPQHAAIQKGLPLAEVGHTSITGRVTPWGAEIRSCSPPILMQQPAEQVAAVHLGSMISAGGGQPSGSVRCLKSEGPVWTMPVVVLDGDPQDLLQVPSADDQQPIQALGADRADPSLREGVCVGCLHRREHHLGLL
jgi:hypothetical protein